MRFEITGGVDPLLSVELERGEKVLAESNAMVAMDGTTAALFRPSGNAAACDVSALGRGVYVVVCQTEEGQALQVKKLVLK